MLKADEIQGCIVLVHIKMGV